MRKIILLAGATIMFAGHAIADVTEASHKVKASDIKPYLCYYEGKAYSVGAIRESDGRYALICKKVNGRSAWAQHDTSYFFGE